MTLLINHQKLLACFYLLCLVIICVVHKSEEELSIALTLS
jgi:hypothetical protein